MTGDDQYSNFGKVQYLHVQNLVTSFTRKTKSGTGAYEEVSKHIIGITNLDQ